MTRIEKDEERETRLHYEIIADAHDEDERAMGWFYYLDDLLHTPFQARCIATHRKSPLREGEKVTVTDLAPEDDCRHEMCVMIEWHDRTLDVPLAQLEGIAT